MENREFSLVLFGATGFTGRFVLEELLDCNADQQLGGAIAVAGRSMSKLRELVSECTTSAQGKHIKVLSDVDVDNQESLLMMCSRTRLVINVVGPFRLYGEPVVRACVECGTDYLDVSGEPEFMERMEAKYHELAAAKGCYIASAAGYDCVPGDFGTVLAQKQFVPPAVPSSVEAYLALKPGPAGYKAHFATWHSAVLGVASVSALRKLRAEVRSRGEGRTALPAPRPVGPKPPAPAGVEFIKHPEVRAFSVPFPGADASVVRRTQAILQAAGQPPVHFTARFLVASRLWGYVMGLVGLTMATLAKTSLGRALLLRFPGFFSFGTVSHAGPTAEQMAQTRCITTLVARGYSVAPPLASSGGREGKACSPPTDRELVLRITAPDPGYRATAIFLVQAALSVLLDRQKLPAPGVHTVGSLLGDTAYAGRLRARGVHIEVVSDKRF